MHRYVTGPWIYFLGVYIVKEALTPWLAEGLHFAMKNGFYALLVVMAWIAVAPFRFIAARSAKSASPASKQSEGETGEKGTSSNWHNNPPEPIPENEEDALKRITKADQQNLFVKRELYTV